MAFDTGTPSPPSIVSASVFSLGSIRAYRFAVLAMVILTRSSAHLCRETAPYPSAYHLSAIKCATPSIVGYTISERRYCPATKGYWRLALCRHWAVKGRGRSLDFAEHALVYFV